MSKSGGEREFASLFFWPAAAPQFMFATTNRHVPSEPTNSHRIANPLGDL